VDPAFRRRGIGSEILEVRLSSCDYADGT
jgi:ribosomal protein S18 acetylase RimI-like enzyme